MAQLVNPCVVLPTGPLNHALARLLKFIFFQSFVLFSFNEETSPAAIIKFLLIEIILSFMGEKKMLQSSSFFFFEMAFQL